MKPDDLDRIFSEAADRNLTEGAARESIERVEGRLLSDLRPVRPLASAGVFTLGFLGLFTLFAIASASILGLRGFHVLSSGQRGLIYLTLLASAWLASSACARELRPSGLRMGTLSLVLSGLFFPVLFALMFHGYGSRNFVAEGVPCLVAGLCVSIPTALVIALLLRRGFVMEWRMAGLAAGTLSGLTGLAMLELHCPNLKAIHIIVWHVAVVIVSALLGFAIGGFADRLRRNFA